MARRPKARTSDKDEILSKEAWLDREKEDLTFGM